MNKTILVIIIIMVVVVGGAIYYFQSPSYQQNYPPETTQFSSSGSNNVIPNDKVLNLSRKNLDSIPMSVFSQTGLEELNVSHNAIGGAIQSQIGQLKNLKVLNASYNNMTGVPAEVGQLTNLEMLDLSYNQLTGLPNELGNLKNLKTLNLVGNSYSTQDLAGIQAKLPNTTFILK